MSSRGWVEVGGDGPFAPPTPLRGYCSPSSHSYGSCYPWVNGDLWEPGTCSLVQQAAVKGRMLDQPTFALLVKGGGETSTPFTGVASVSSPLPTDTFHGCPLEKETLAWLVKRGGKPHSFQ